MLRELWYPVCGRGDASSKDGTVTSPESKQIRAGLRDVSKQEPIEEQPIEEQRRAWEAAAAQAVLPPGVHVEAASVAGRPAEWVRGSAQAGVLLFLHGGGFTSGSCITHRELAARLALSSGLTVLVLDYRLAPEHPFPAASDDAAAAYRWLLVQGWAPGQLAIGGDSAGACVALSALLRLKSDDIAMPAAAVLISPWLDLSLSGESLRTRAASDPLVSREDLAVAARHYLAGAAPSDPMASPLFGDLHDLPPLLVQVGGDEVLLSDAERLAERATAAGVCARLRVWPEMWHVWHGWAAVLPEGQAAIAEAGAFLREHVVG
jgi:acetyl esterase/lipase